MPKKRGTKESNDLVVTFVTEARTGRVPCPIACLRFGRAVRRFGRVAWVGSCGTLTSGVDGAPRAEKTFGKTRVEGPIDVTPSSLRLHGDGKHGLKPCTHRAQCPTPTALEELCQRRLLCLASCGHSFTGKLQAFPSVKRVVWRLQFLLVSALLQQILAKCAGTVEYW